LLNNIIYFDNAATSNFKPRIVKKTLIKTLKLSANPGRSGHKLSILNAFKVFKVRQNIANYFGIDEPENVIFTKNCTEALNIAIKGTLKKGGHVICSCFDHNSILRPLTNLFNYGNISLTFAKPEENNIYITRKDIEKHINNKTYLVCLTAFSNVTGNKNDIENIAKLCREKNILFLLDFAQGAGHLKLNMKKTGINYLTFAGHKGFLAPQGIGGLCINSNVKPMPIMEGGTGTESINLSQPTALPESLESGTIATPLITSLDSGIKYIEKHFIKNCNKTTKLTKYLYDNLKEIKEIKIYSEPNFSSGIIAFNYLDIDSNIISDYLDQNYNIATRSGLHCAPLTHKYYNTTNQGMVRISLNFKNTKKQIKILINALKNFKI